MNLHFLFTSNADVIANMNALIQTGDAIILLNGASLVCLNTTNGNTIYARNTTNSPTVHVISDQQWLSLCDNAQLIHSWY